MSDMKRLEIPPMSARAFELAAGRWLRIVDVVGGQPGDLVAFNPRNLSERFSQARTRVENGSVRVTTGCGLYSNVQPPRTLLTIVEDTAGRHDLLYSPCCRYALEKRFGVSRDGCLEHLAQALRPWGLAVGDIPDPLSLFFTVQLEPNGAMALGEHTSRPGDHVTFRAEMDCLVAVSTCSVPIAGRENSGYLIETT